MCWNFGLNFNLFSGGLFNCMSFPMFQMPTFNWFGMGSYMPQMPNFNLFSSSLFTPQIPIPNFQYNASIFPTSNATPTFMFNSTTTTQEQSKAQASNPENNNADKENHVTTNKEIQLTAEIKNQILNGTYQGDKITLSNVTHYRYNDCNSADLKSVGNGQQMHKDAAAAFKNMQAAAAKAGITLSAVSGFRSKQYQIGTFKKKGSSDAVIKERVKVSAPSGFSEHHTGYAVDINSLSENFANTAAFKWLSQHAKDYGFEMSFPKNNFQGVAYEPWHWRYVGNQTAKNTFSTVRSQDPRFK